MDLTPNKYYQALSYLTINSSFLKDLGLFHGRMGIVLFFAHYARVTQSKQYEDFAGILLDEIYEEIHWDLPINLENGLCGIGWGIEYLVQHGFMEGNTDEILADIDRKVMEIDPSRISDLSFRQGAAGIAFYVIARLNAKRQTPVLPFNTTYLKSLEKTLKRIEFLDKDESLLNLTVLLQHVLNGKKISLNLPNYLIYSKLSIDTTFDNLLIGLEKGLTGWLWNNINTIENSYNLLFEKDKCIFLFDQEGRSTKYGIGTYINQVINSMQNTEYQIVMIRIFCNQNNPHQIYKDKKAIYFTLSGFKSRGGNELLKKYYRNIFFTLYPYFMHANHPIFHLNAMQDETFVSLIKKYFPNIPIVLTLHYTSWSFQLLGDKNKLKDILTSPNRAENKAIVQDFYQEKRLMQSCDQIIAISKHSFNDIVNLYQIPKGKITFIPHGLQDSYHFLSKDQKIELRKKYGFLEDAQILIFAGRIDRIKGIDFLAETFTLLQKKYPKLHLIVAGDGCFDQILPLLNPIWGKVTYTGFIEKSILYELLSISDIGVLPSLHEEFGFVALEMMMMKLPLIAGRTTGLSELVENEKSGLLVSMKNKDREQTIFLLYNAISKLLIDANKRVQMAQEGRSFFIQKYNLEIFRERMNFFYNNLLYREYKFNR